MKDIEIGFVFVNYNNSEYSLALLRSLYTKNSSNSFYTVIVDNSVSHEEEEKLKESYAINKNIILIFSKENIGYFGGLNLGIDFLRKKNTTIKTIVIGNNDLIFPEKIIDQIKTCLNEFANYPVISPNIITLDKVHQNPHLMSNPTIIREMIWDVYYSNYTLSIFMSIINNFLKRYTERKDYINHEASMEINQGYGACYILTPTFFDHFSQLWSPNFLMGEEFFLSKQIQDKGLKIYYYSQIKIQHHDHATISKLPSKKTWEYGKKAHGIYKCHVNPYNIFNKDLRK